MNLTLRQERSLSDCFDVGHTLYMFRIQMWDSSNKVFPGSIRLKYIFSNFTQSKFIEAFPYAFVISFGGILNPLPTAFGRRGFWLPFKQTRAITMEAVHAHNHTRCAVMVEKQRRGRMQLVGFCGA